MKARSGIDRHIKTQYFQKDLLLEALDTEVSFCIYALFYFHKLMRFCLLAMVSR